MPRIQLYIHGHLIEDVPVIIPRPVKKLSPEGNFLARKQAVEEKALEIKARRLNAILKYPEEYAVYLVGRAE